MLSIFDHFSFLLTWFLDDFRQEQRKQNPLISCIGFATKSDYNGYNYNN